MVKIPLILVIFFKPSLALVRQGKFSSKQDDNVSETIDSVRTGPGAAGVVVDEPLFSNVNL